MMNKLNITDIKTWVKKLFTHESKKRERGADYAWAVLLVIAILVAVATSAWHLYLFVQVENDNIFQIIEEEEDKRAEINVKVLQETIDRFDQKETRFNSILNEKPAIVDPSL